MIGSIKCLRRLSAPLFAPMLVVAIGVPTRPDPINKRTVGTAAVIAIPSGAASATNANGRDVQPADVRRDTRAERGRVLYAPGHAPRDTAAAHPARKQPCPETRVVQARVPSAPTGV
jgi:hypothetical protein